MQAVNHKQLFLASRIALIVTSMTFAFRASLEGIWGAEFNLSAAHVTYSVVWLFNNNH